MAVFGRRFGPFLEAKLLVSGIMRLTKPARAYDARLQDIDRLAV